MDQKTDFVRLQKIIASYTHYSRRHAEQLISAGHVSVNGQVVQKLGTKAFYGDEIKIKNKLITKKRINSYIMIHKPCFVMCTSFDPQHRVTITSLLHEKYYPPLYSVGRLDYDTSGLLLLTNDGDFCYNITHPKQVVAKTYIVTLDKPLAKSHMQALAHGVVIGHGQTTHPANIKTILHQKLPQVQITITQGYNRQIKRMFGKFNYTVIGLHRIAIGSLILPKTLLPGEYMSLTSTMHNLIFTTPSERKRYENRKRE